MDVLKDEQEPLGLHFERARDGLAGLNDLPAGATGPYHENRLQVSVADPVQSYFVLMFSFEVARSLSAIAGELALAAPATIVG